MGRKHTPALASGRQNPLGYALCTRSTVRTLPNKKHQSRACIQQNLHNTFYFQISS